MAYRGHIPIFGVFGDFVKKEQKITGFDPQNRVFRSKMPLFENREIGFY
jgi:hypothetical protein